MKSDASKTSEIVFMLVTIMLCSLIAWIYGMRQAAQDQIESRVHLMDAQPWMFQSLPGIGPKKSKVLVEQAHAQQEMNWPKRSRPYLEWVFIDYASASKKAVHER